MISIVSSLSDFDTSITLDSNVAPVNTNAHGDIVITTSVRCLRSDEGSYGVYIYGVVKRFHLQRVNASCGRESIDNSDSKGISPLVSTVEFGDCPRTVTVRAYLHVHGLSIRWTRVNLSVHQLRVYIVPVATGELLLV